MSSACSVVIPSWNSREHLGRCLASLEGQVEPNDVVVVDNGSTDGTLAWMAREHPQVQLVRHAVNLGFAVAVNAGVRVATREHVLILNADCEVEAGCLDALHARLVAAAPRTAAVQPLVLQQGTDVIRIYSRGQGALRDGRAFEVAAGTEAGDRRSEAPSEVLGVCGAACLFDRAAFLALGGYDESFFAFYEDVELNLRARLLGWRFELVPDAVVWHVGNAVWQRSAARPADFNARLVARNRLTCDLKLLPAPWLPRALLVELLSVVRSVEAGTVRATAGGKAEALARLRPTLRARRLLRRQGDVRQLRAAMDAQPTDARRPLLRPVRPAAGPDARTDLTDVRP